jgi:hypothetical protein
MLRSGRSAMPENIDEHDKVQDYRDALESIVIVGRILLSHDLPELLRAIERAHAFGPILDPTLYREKSKAMELDKEWFKAALPLYRHAEKMAKEERERVAAAAQVPPGS